ncbi:MAG: helix-turn-helix transcriptional regulator [Parachlamydiaceae bacterium]|nr:helix-turn-helix transcriptional regulator [Parachlamydiaceae bacterium]
MSEEKNLDLHIYRYYNIFYTDYNIIEVIMISIDMTTPQEMQKKIAQKLRAKRLALDLSQQTLSEKSGVSYGVLKKFERTGKISLESLLKLALALGSMDDFNALFAPHKYETALSLDQLMEDGTRKRGRK